jgi:hypothetical protein
MSERGRFSDLVTIKSNKMAVIVMGILRFLQKFSGVSSFTLYAQLLFKEATDAILQQWAAMLMMVIQAILTLLAVLILDVDFNQGLTLIFSGVFFTIRDLSLLDVSHLEVLPLVGLILFIAFFALGLGSAVSLLLGELFPANVKAKAACLMNMIFAIGMFVSTKFFQYMADEYSLVVPFFVFAACQFVDFLLCLKNVPGTDPAGTQPGT